eukprot:2431969-Heterocapsa_arctica.AAC.1
MNRFLELFAGAGGLTAAVRRTGNAVEEAQDLRDPSGRGFQHQFDLLNNEHYALVKKLCRSGKIRWLHGGPPCKTFTMARRSDRFGTARILRSVDLPEGIPPLSQRVRDANVLATRMARLARVVHKAGGFFTIENPE